MLNVFTGFSMDEDGHELMPHGTEDFPCVGYKEYHSDRPGGDFPWHWHNDFEVIICDSGGIRVKVPGASTLLGTGDACFINSSIMHYIIGEPEGTMRSIVAFRPCSLAQSIPSSPRATSCPCSATARLPW